MRAQTPGMRSLRRRNELYCRMDMSLFGGVLLALLFLLMANQPSPHSSVFGFMECPGASTPLRSPVPLEKMPCAS
jgi:hypothetical protein